MKVSFTRSRIKVSLQHQDVFRTNETYGWVGYLGPVRIFSVLRMRGRRNKGFERSARSHPPSTDTVVWSGIRFDEWGQLYKTSNYPRWIPSLLLGFGLSLTASTPRCLASANSSLSYGRQSPATGGAWYCSLLPEYGRRCIESRKGGFKCHVSKDCL